MLILHPPEKPLKPTQSAEDWKAFLAQPEKHWKPGRSAKMLAECWESSRPDLPQEFRTAFSGTPFESFVPLLAMPEYCVDLPGGSRPSQNDIFVVGRIGDELAVIMVEGKVDESFGLPPIQWTGKCLSFVSVPHPRWSQKLPLRQRRRGVEGS